MILILCAVIFWVFAWILNAKLANSALSETRAVKLLVPVIFGFTIIGVWELLVRGLEVPLVILPPPSLVIETASQNLEINPYRINPAKKGLRARLEEDIRWARCDIKTTGLIGNVLSLHDQTKDEVDEILFHKNGIIHEG